MKEIRKLQVTAGGTYILTIPKEWAETLKAEKGTMLNMELDNGSIIISSNMIRETESHSINMAGIVDRKSLELRIISSYILGHDITEIYSEDHDNEWKDWVKETLKGLIGIEISEEYSGRILLQNLIDPYKFDLTSSMDKFVKNSMAVLSDSIISLSRNENFLSKDAYNRGKELIRTYRLLMRLVILAGKDKELCTKYRFSNLTDTTMVAIAIREIGRIAYYAMRTAEHSSEFEYKLDTSLLESLKDMEKLTEEMVTKSFKSLMERDISLASWVMDSMVRIREIYEKIMESSSFLNMKGRLTISLIVRDLRAIAGYAVALADDSILGIST